MSARNMYSIDLMVDYIKIYEIEISFKQHIYYKVKI